MSGYTDKLGEVFGHLADAMVGLREAGVWLDRDGRGDLAQLHRKISKVNQKIHSIIRNERDADHSPKGGP